MFDFIKSVAEKLLDYDTNITDYEKMENKYKINRKKLILIAFSLLVLISFNSAISFFLTHDFAGFHGHFTVGTLLVLLVAVFIFRQNHIQKVAMFIGYIILPVFISISLIKVYYEGFNIINLCVSIFLISFMLLMYSSAYMFVRDKFTMGEPVELTFIIADKDPLKAKLISITKSGDYIIKIDGEEDQEILLIKDHILQIIYKKASEQS
ncbi:hypothetical protein [Cytobacillus oceanisediminis]|uniref:Uncharacterized protein n=1 Tax=Cytobacillus oceanisediminis 2691 TaxID=1196031 RepID=A0A160MAV2_9BACI|nr:hypothetical protein [Cytobacillus oceanisediminis]AND39633.1 hypothetical protein A361_10950 [Cytobacillus oceanisediminis 2691]